MLVLTRRLGESLVIGGTITVKVVALKGRRVGIGIDAPAATLIDRAEVHERKVLEAALVKPALVK